MYNTEIKITYVMMNESILLEDRLQYLKDNTGSISTEHDPEGIHKDKDSIIQHLADNGDPTKNKAYTQYAVGLYKAKGLKQNEAPRLKDALSNFDKYKGHLTSDEKTVSVKQYPNIQSIEDKVKPFLGTITKSQKAREMSAVKKNPLDSEGHKLVHEDKDLAIYHVTSHEKSKAIYGGEYTGKEGSLGTNWCTATRAPSGNEHWKNHENENLYAVHDKATGKVYQFSHGIDSKGKPSEEFTNAENGELINRISGKVLNDEVHPLLKKLGSAIEKTPSLVPVSDGKGKPTGADKFAVRYGSGAILDKMVSHSDPEIRESVLKNQLISPDHLHKVFDENMSDNLKEVAASNPSADSSLLHKALDNGDSWTQEAVAKNPSAKPEHLHRIFDENMDASAQYYAVKNKPADSSLLHKALDNGDPWTQEAVAKNPSAKPEHLYRVFDENMQSTVKFAALGNPSADSSLLHKALDESDESVQKQALASQKIDSSHIDKALDSPYRSIRMRAVQHDNVSDKNLEKALTDSDSDVRTVAKNSIEINKFINDNYK